MIVPVLLGYGDKGEYGCLRDGLKCDPAALFELLKTLHCCSAQTDGKYQLKKSSKYLSRQPSADVVLGNTEMMYLDVKAMKVCYICYITVS